MGGSRNTSCYPEKRLSFFIFVSLPKSLFVFVFFLFFYYYLQQALLTPDYGTGASTLSVNRRESFIQENGKVALTGIRGGPDGASYCDIGTALLYHPELEVKNERPLGLKKKLYEFYTAPISKFWSHSVSSSNEKYRP